MGELTTIAFDADDTLWQNEQFFRLTETRFFELLDSHVDGPIAAERLLATEKRNLEFYGYGIKGFTLSMIETALEITEGRIEAAAISEILSLGRTMLRHPVQTLPGVEDTLQALSGSYRLLLITKGDLFDQERKLAQSGLGELFDNVEIVSDKTTETYRRIFRQHGEGAEQSMMIGNSLKSDIIPALEAGCWGVYVPHALTWAVEHAEEPADHPRFRKTERLDGVLDLLRSIEQQ